MTKVQTKLVKPRKKYYNTVMNINCKIKGMESKLQLAVYVKITFTNEMKTVFYFFFLLQISTKLLIFRWK